MPTLPQLRKQFKEKNAAYENLRASTTPEIDRLRKQLWDAENAHRQSIATEANRLFSEVNKLRVQVYDAKEKSRWPSDTPAEILEFCKTYWNGTEEYRTFRIHCWNDKAVWTGWPSGGYSDNGGFHSTSACFKLLSRIEKDYHKAKILKTLRGRVNLKTMQAELDALGITT